MSAGAAPPSKPGRAVAAPNGAERGAASAQSPASVVAEPAPGQVSHLALDAIRPGTYQPRRGFDEAQLAELAASIRSAGVVQPIVVRAIDAGAARAGEAGGARYELVAGERRWRAARLAGLAKIPAVVARLSDEQAAEWALIENLQRADLTPMERAFAVRSLCENFSLSHAQVAERLGIDRSSVANLVRLTELEEAIRTKIESGALSMGHGKVLLGMPAGPGRATLAESAAAGGWSVRRLEEAIARATRAPGAPVTAGATAEPRASLAQAGLSDLEKQLGDHLGTKVQVRLRKGGKSGALVLRFYDLDHFDGLMSRMGFVLK